MKKKNNDSFWEEGSFIQTMSSEEAKHKLRTINMKHDEEMNYDCRACKKKISAHNNDWHDGMCDECFNKEHFGK